MFNQPICQALLCVVLGLRRKSFGHCWSRFYLTRKMSFLKPKQQHVQSI